MLTSTLPVTFTVSVPAQASKALEPGSTNAGPWHSRVKSPPTNETTGFVVSTTWTMSVVVLLFPLGSVDVYVST